MITVWTDAAKLDRWEAMECYIDKGAPEAALELGSVGIEKNEN